MTYDEFRKEFFVFFKWAMNCSVKARDEGLLALEEELEQIKPSKLDLVKIGMRLVVDGTDAEIIDKILSNIINQEKDEYAKILQQIQKEAVLSIQAGDNTRISAILMNSYTDIPLDDPEYKEIVDGVYAELEHRANVRRAR